jgi:hypothetical protein
MIFRTKHSKVHIVFLVIIVFFKIDCFSKSIKRQELKSDFEQFKSIIYTESSYYQLTNYDFIKHFEEIDKEISACDSMTIYKFASILEEVLSNLIDRHANIRYNELDEEKHPQSTFHFPFALAPLNNNLLCIINSNDKFEYIIYDCMYPYLKSINGYSIEDFIDKFVCNRKLSPDKAKYYNFSRDIRYIGDIFLKNDILLDGFNLDIVLTDLVEDKFISLPLSRKKTTWRDIGAKNNNLLSYELYLNKSNFDFTKLDKWIEDDIAYLAIPEMLSYKEYPSLENYIHKVFNTYKNASAMIIDIRDNGGGTRDILKTISEYIVLQNQSPWVANIAYVRSDQSLNEDIASMAGRYLYNIDSEYFCEKDRKAIRKFYNSFTPQLDFNYNRFSEPYFMLLHSGKVSINCPIYILVNERCFSAASVFTAAFKGLPNVTIAGVKTNGSSGRSKKFNLKNSKIRIKISTMISIQRNGYPLDGCGTTPDLTLERDMNQILGKSDSQLSALLNYINESNKSN